MLTGSANALCQHDTISDLRMPFHFKPLIFLHRIPKFLDFPGHLQRTSIFGILRVIDNSMKIQIVKDKDRTNIGVFP